MELDHLCGGEEPLLRTRGMMPDHVVFTVRHSRGSYRVISVLSLWKGPHWKGNQSIHSRLASARKKVRLTNGSSSRIQLTLYANRPTHHGASRLVHAMSAWSVKNDVLRPDIVGMGVSMVA